MESRTGLWALIETFCIYYLVLFYLKSDPKCRTGSETDRMVVAFLLAIIGRIIERAGCKLWVRS